MMFLGASSVCIYGIEKLESHQIKGLLNFYLVPSIKRVQKHFYHVLAKLKTMKATSHSYFFQ
jgi:hypothetical protein